MSIFYNYSIARRSARPEEECPSFQLVFSKQFHKERGTVDSDSILFFLGKGEGGRARCWWTGQVRGRKKSLGRLRKKRAEKGKNGGPDLTFFRQEKKKKTGRHGRCCDRSSTMCFGGGKGEKEKSILIFIVLMRKKKKRNQAARPISIVFPEKVAGGEKKKKKEKREYRPAARLSHAGPQQGKKKRTRPMSVPLLLKTSL